MQGIMARFKTGVASNNLSVARDKLRHCLFLLVPVQSLEKGGVNVFVMSQRRLAETMSTWVPG